MPNTYVGTAAALNGQTIASFNPGDEIQITDETPNAANVHLSGDMVEYTGGAITIDNLGPGRYVVRALGTAGTDIRLQEDAHNDINGDGRSDVLLRNTDGTVNEWLGLQDGSFASNISHVNYSVGSGWNIVGTGDFNGDGRVDMLWQNTDGTISDWLGQADGSFFPNGHTFSVNPGTQWHVVGTGDFNGDGRTDVLLRNDSGVVNEWLGLPDGSFASNIAHVNYNVSSDWHIVGTGDFNGDGRDDILWQNTDGTITDWLGQADGSFLPNGHTFSVNPGTQWHVVATGDFNGDGRSDILLRNDSGTVNEWLGLPDGSFASNIAHVNYSVPTSWHVAGVGDFNGDAIDDLLWQNTDGTISDWLGQTDGSFFPNGHTFSVNPGTQWHIQDPSVHDPFM